MSPSSEIEISIAILSLLFGGLQWYHARLEAIKQELANSAALSLELSLIGVYDVEKPRQMELAIINCARALPKFSLSDKDVEIMTRQIHHSLELENFVEIMTIHESVWTNTIKSIPGLVHEKLSLLLKDSKNRILSNAYQEETKTAVIDPLFLNRCQFISDNLCSHLSGKLHYQIEKLVKEYQSDWPPTPPPTNHEWIAFADKESEYKKWVEANPNGFILTTAKFAKKLVEGVVLHTSRCWTVTNFAKSKPGAFVEGAYMKVCANEVEPLREWLKANGKASGEFDRACGLCKPLGIKPVPFPPKKIVEAKLEKHQIVITASDKAAIEKIKLACEKLPPAQGNYLINDYIDNLLLTVLDFMQHTKVVVKAQQHYFDNEKAHLRKYYDITRFLETEPDTKEGNTRLAQKLWGYNLHTKIGLLRGLVEYFGVIGALIKKSSLSGPKLRSSVISLDKSLG